jgi:hypothetical protein
MNGENSMTSRFNEIPTAEYRALYSVYLACLDAQLRREKLPKRVSAAMPDVEQAYAAQGADAYGVLASAKR